MKPFTAGVVRKPVPMLELARRLDEAADLTADWALDDMSRGEILLLQGCTISLRSIAAILRLIGGA